MADAEAFVCPLYNHGTDGVDINEERAAAFRKVKKNLDSLPSMKDALPVHCFSMVINGTQGENYCTLIL